MHNNNVYDFVVFVVIGCNASIFRHLISVSVLMTSFLHSADMYANI